MEVFDPATGALVEVPEALPPGVPLPVNPDLDPGVPVNPGPGLPPFAVPPPPVAPSAAPVPVPVAPPPEPVVPATPAVPPPPAAPAAPVTGQPARKPRPGAPDPLAGIDKATGAAGAAELEARRESGAVKAERAGQTDQLMEGASAAEDDRAAKLDEALQFGNQRLAQAQERYDTRVKDYEDSTKIKGYFETHSKLGSALMVALGGFGSGAKAAANIYAGVAGGGRPFESTANVGLQMLEKDIDDDHKRQLERVDMAKDRVLMAKYGVQDAREAKRLAVEDVNAKYDAIWKSVEVRAKRIAAYHGKDEAEADNEAAVQLAKQKQLEARQNNIVEQKKLVLDEIRTRAQAAASYANATESRARAKAYDENRLGKGVNVTVNNEVKPVALEFDKDEARLMGTSRTPGLIAKQQEVRQLGNEIREAAASGDPQRLAAAVVAGREKIARLNTGAAPSHEQMKLLFGLTGKPAEFEEKVHQLFGDPKSAKQTVDGLVHLIDGSDEAMVKQIDAARQGLVTKYQGNGKAKGIATTPAQRQYVDSRLAGLTGQVTVRTPEGEKPRYQEGGAVPGAPGKAEKPPGPPPKLSPADAIALTDYVKKNPNAPDAEEARALLRAAVKR